jgi:HK97 family phage major capsid protein
MTDEERETEEKRKREDEAHASEGAVTVKLDDLKEVVRETVEETVTERLKAAGVGEVDRSKVAVRSEEENDDSTRNAGSASRTTPAFEELYRTLPEWEQRIRTPEADHHIGQWAVGVMRNDHGLMARSHDAIHRAMGTTRDLNTTSDSALVPSPLANIIVEKKRKIQVIGPRARTFVSAATTLGIPTEATFAAAAGVAEAGTITPADPTYGTVTLTKKKSVVSTRSSVEFIEDNAFNAVSFLSEQAARTIAIRNDAQDFADGDGTGTNQTDAIENNTSITSVDATVGTMVYGDVQALWFALLSQYRSGAVWMGSNNIIKELSDIVDANSRPIFNAGEMPASGLSGGQGAPGVGMIFGRPLLEVPGSTGVLVLGDLNYYGVLEHGSIRAEFSRDEAFLTDEHTWKWVQRRDGAVLQPEAFKKLGGITEA